MPLSQFAVELLHAVILPCHYLPLPPHSPFHCYLSVTGAWITVCGDSWLGCGDLPPMGVFLLSSGWLIRAQGPSGHPEHPQSIQLDSVVNRNKF